jgi:hypothetical protein
MRSCKSFFKGIFIILAGCTFVGVLVYLFLKKLFYAEGECEGGCCDIQDHVEEGTQVDEEVRAYEAESVEEEEFNKRQRKILFLFKKRLTLSMSNLKEEFHQVTTRTLRRDLDKFEELGLIKQRGKTKDSVYVYVG